MKLRQILNYKGNKVHTITKHATLQDVIDGLIKNNCGSLVVLHKEKMCGIVTERDILRAAAQGSPLSTSRVEHSMTADLIVGSPQESINTAMGLMTDHRIRHLPVVEQDRLIGIISIGDVVKAQHAQLSMENHYLKNYIQN